MLICVSCNQDKKPDVSKLNLDVKILRFDRDLYSRKSKNIGETAISLRKKYANFYDDYIFKMVGNDEYTEHEIIQTLYNDQAYTDLTKEVDSVYQDLRPIEKDLTLAFKYVKYYYPKAKVPAFISFVSGFAVQTPVGDNYMGIGLDMFLGKESKFYKAIVQSVPSYLSRRFSKDYIVPRITETYAREELFPDRDENRTLLSKMIYNGKILYFMDAILEEKVPDSVKIGYTDNQMGWCEAFESDIWAFYLENNLLFETDYQKIQVYLSEGPFTPGLGEKNESAPKLGIWTGWQIVRKYMAENKDVTLQQLMAEQDAQKILNKSKYKPNN
ncbi:MAG: gliding motility lipoprotein GldB [Pedobacter sp.]|nr:MAG: gliding motility lipoprotein GldB [Pedobacter sp.]